MSFENSSSNEIQNQAEMLSHDASESDETQQRQAPTSSEESSDSNSDSSEETETPNLTWDERKATTKGKDAKPFTSLIKYPTLLIKPPPILNHPVYVCQPDWDKKCDIVHKSLVSINALQGSCDELRSTLDERLRFFEAFAAPSTSALGPSSNGPETTPKSTPSATFSTNMQNTIAKVTAASNKLMDMETQLRWKNITVVDSLCKSCDQEYRDDWTELHENWDHPPGWKQCCFGNGWLRKEEGMLEGLGLGE
ncbi:MAG: hypothetical protein Q9226_004804 [Calogaya cf. arnoldii]